MTTTVQWLQAIHQILSDPVTILVITTITSIVVSRSHEKKPQIPLLLKKIRDCD
jgi:hypothetical protein